MAKRLEPYRQEIKALERAINLMIRSRDSICKELNAVTDGPMSSNRSYPVKDALSRAADALSISIHNAEYRLARLRENPYA